MDCASALQVFQLFNNRKFKLRILFGCTDVHVLLTIVLDKPSLHCC